MLARGRNARASLAVLLLAVGPAPLVAQQVDGVDLERRGLYEQALEAYRREIETDRADVSAWLGLERLLGQMGRLESLIPLIDTVLTEDPDNRFVREIELRTWSSLGRIDSLEAAAIRWIDVAPEATAPYRQWAFALARRGEYEQAIGILEKGKARLGGPALAPELARLHASAGNWHAAAEEWRSAVVANESYTLSAVAALRDAPKWARESLLAPLTHPDADPAASRLGAELLVMWERSAEGWALLDASLPEDDEDAVSVLARFVERTRRMDTADAARARGYALERLAGLSDGPDAERAVLEAAQAFADAGELGGARRMLEQLAESPTTAPADAGDAMATVIRVTIELGRVEEAEQRFLDWQERLNADDAEDLRRRLARAWIERGELDKASALLEQDASIGSLALLGWTRLYSGDLNGATELFRTAGPYALSREEATRRTGVLALMQRIEADSLPELGKALLTLARGDSAQAIEQLSETAGLLPQTGGRAEVLTMAGELAIARRDYGRAEPILLEALAADSVGPAAPAAEYAMAVVLTRTERLEEAEQRLEHLILAYSDSAVVPDARRLLDQLRGAVPRS
jgi:tetratricopeptide (TPR) repeat protein